MTPALREKFLEGCREAIRNKNVGLLLYKIALQMRLEGLSQQEAYEIIGSAKEAVTGSKFYGDDPKDDAICDVLDGVVGYCSSSCHIWSPGFDAKKALSNIEGKNAAGIEQGAAPNGGPVEPSGKP